MAGQVNERQLRRRAVRKSRVERAGLAMFGERYQTLLARDLGVSQSTVAQIVGGVIGTSDDLHSKLKQACITEAENLSERIRILYGLAIEITEDRDDPPSMKP